MSKKETYKLILSSILGTLVGLISGLVLIMLNVINFMGDYSICYWDPSDCDHVLFESYPFLLSSIVVSIIIGWIVGWFFYRRQDTYFRYFIGTFFGTLISLSLSSWIISIDTFRYDLDNGLAIGCVSIFTILNIVLIFFASNSYLKTQVGSVSINGVEVLVREPIKQNRLQILIAIPGYILGLLGGLILWFLAMSYELGLIQGCEGEGGCDYIFQDYLSDYFIVGFIFSIIIGYLVGRKFYRKRATYLRWFLGILFGSLITLSLMSLLASLSINDINETWQCTSLLFVIFIVLVIVATTAYRKVSTR